MIKYFWSILITVALIGSAWAGIVSKPNTFVDATVASASEVNADFDTLYTLVNGNIDNANISGTAAIVFSKLDTATVAGVTESQTLTNKTLTTPVIASFYQDAAKTKLMTVPNVASDTLVTLAASQSLSTKTLVSPVITTSPTAAGSTWTDLGTVTTAAFTTITNLGSVTTADINGGTIDGTTIATSDITVGSGKTLNVSAGTLTLADNQISGDKVEGGTIAATTITALSLGSMATNWTNAGRTIADLGTVTTATSITSLDGAMYGQPLVWSKTLILPEYIQDETDFVPLMVVDSSWAPYGIKITKVGMALNANNASGYAIMLEKWTYASPPAAEENILTTNLDPGASASVTTTTNTFTGTTTYYDVPVSKIIGVDLPTTTGTKTLTVWFTYEIKGS